MEENKEAMEISFTRASVENATPESFAELKAYIDTNVAQYRGIVVTEGNLSQVKDWLANLRKAFDRLEAGRKKAKKECEAPYKAWEVLYLEAIEGLMEVINDLSTQQKALDAIQKEARIADRKRNVVKDASDIRSGLGNMIQNHKALWDRVWKSEYENKSCSDTKMQLETRQELMAISNDLDVIAQMKGVAQILPKFLDCGSLSEAISWERSYRETVDEIKEEASNEAATEVTYTVSVTKTPTEEDMVLASGRRAFKGPKYKVLALFKLAEEMGLELEKI